MGRIGKYLLVTSLFLIGLPATAQQVSPQPFGSKYYAGSSLRYVDSAGNDSNDGLSPGTAKLTIMAAYDALPAAGGTIRVCAQGGGVVSATSTAGQGIKLAGSADPNYSSLPAPWRKIKAVSFIGDCGNTSNQQGNKPQVAISSGSSTVGGDPGIQISSTSNGDAKVSFENFLLQYPAIDVKLGFDSNGNQTTNSGVVGVRFENMTTNDCNSCGSTAGPGWFIGGGDTFGIDIDHVVAQGNPNATVGADNQAAILVKATGGTSATGLSTLTDSVLTGGGFKFYEGTNGSGWTLFHNYSEAINGGSLGVATVWIASAQYASIIDIDTTTTDFSGTVYDLRVDGTINPDEGGVMAVGAFPNGILGPVNFSGSIFAPVSDPLAQGQTGINNGRLFAFVTNTQRQFGPSAIRFANLAPTSSASWVVTGGGSSTITTGITAPDGTTGAVSVVSTSGQQAVRYFNSSVSVAANDWFVGASFEASPDATQFQDYSGVSNLQILGSGDTTACTRLFPPFTTQGEWEWVYTVCQLTAAPTTPATVILQNYFSPTTPLQVYAPMLIHIPASAGLSASEVYEFANSLNPYNTNCPVGTICGLNFPTGSAGTVTLVSGAGSHTFTTPYVATPVCVAADTTATNAVKVTQSTTAVTLAGTGTDVINWHCSPASN